MTIEVYGGMKGHLGACMAIYRGIQWELYMVIWAHEGVHDQRGVQGIRSMHGHWVYGTYRDVHDHSVVLGVWGTYGHKVHCHRGMWRHIGAYTCAWGIKGYT